MSFLDRSLPFKIGDITHISSLKVVRIFIELLRAKVKLRKKMRGDFWHYLKKSVHCKPNPSEVHEPEAAIQKGIPLKNSNSKDCFQRTSKMKSSRNSDILNPITHKVVHDISRCCPPRPHESRRPTTTISKKGHHVDCTECNISSLNSRFLMQTDFDSINNKPSTLFCLKCGEKLKFVDDAVEEHNISHHSVMKLDEEDSTRKIIETICRTTNCSNSQTKKSGQIESVLKVQNSPKTFARFENYREMIKNNAEKLDKNEQPRCLVDGNELLRFHGTTLTCSLPINDSSYSGLCSSQHCCVCQILKHGSFTTNQFHGSSFGVLTSSTCDKAFESIGSFDSDSELSKRKSVMVCRVIAGRILYSSVEEVVKAEISGFDSLAEKRDSDSEIEELHVLDPRAILPCFVLIYKP